MRQESGITGSEISGVQAAAKSLLTGLFRDQVNPLPLCHAPNEVSIGKDKGLDGLEAGLVRGEILYAPSLIFRKRWSILPLPQVVNQGAVRAVKLVALLP